MLLTVWFCLLIGYVNLSPIDPNNNSAKIETKPSDLEPGNIKIKVPEIDLRAEETVYYRYNNPPYYRKPEERIYRKKFYASPVAARGGGG